MIVVIEGELPDEQNRRGGAGWWMDVDGVWRAPTEWPEDTPPVVGWRRDADGMWREPLDSPAAEPSHRLTTIVHEPAVLTRVAQASDRSRQAESDRRAMFSVVGMLGGAALLLAVALILITQAGAADPDEPPTPSTGVIYAADTDQTRLQQQIEAAERAPEAARATLEALLVRPFDQLDTTTEAGVFDPLEWVASGDGCLDIDEKVLVARSAVPVTWADQLECVPDGGRWSDRYLGTSLTRTLEAEVEPLLPVQVVYESGGSTWSTATRQAYLTDMVHPATLQIVAAGSGHNPRAQDPSQWKPGDSGMWCAYAVDWISVKSRWELDVTAAEKSSLAEMLDTCGSSSSDGADPSRVTLDALAPAPIERIVADD